MTKRIALALAVVTALFALVTAPAAAQEVRELTIDPANVDAAGEVEVTVTGAGWTQPGAVIPCAAPETGDLADVDPDSCDAGLITPVTPDADGNFSATLTLDVPEEGLSIIAIDLATQGQEEVGAALLTVGSGEEGEGEPGEGEEGGEGSEGEEGEEGAGEEEGEEELANTGVESGLIAIVAAAVLGGGLMVLATARRRTA